MIKDLIVSDSSSIVPCWVFAERITILADHGQTGSFGVFVHDASEGAGPDPHSHPWDEAFYVANGEVDFECDDMSKKVTASGFVHVPGGMVHAFRMRARRPAYGITSGEGAAAMFRRFDNEFRQKQAQIGISLR